jgi:phage terminase small subunit
MIPHTQRRRPTIARALAAALAVAAFLSTLPAPAAPLKTTRGKTLDVTALEIDKDDPSKVSVTLESGAVLGLPRSGVVPPAEEWTKLAQGHRAAGRMVEAVQVARLLTHWDPNDELAARFLDDLLRERYASSTADFEMALARGDVEALQRHIATSKDDEDLRKALEGVLGAEAKRWTEQVDSSSLVQAEAMRKIIASAAPNSAELKALDAKLAEVKSAQAGAAQDQIERDREMRMSIERQEAIGRAMGYSRDGSYEKASREIANLEKATPDNPDVQQARRAINLAEAARLKPNLLAHVQGFIQQDHYAECVRVLEEYQALNPDDPDALKIYDDVYDAHAKYIQKLKAAQDPKTGIVINYPADNRDVDDFSARIYIPQSVDGWTPMSIMYGFDPRADTDLIVSQFKDAAEKYGFVIYMSNFATGNQLWQKVYVVQNRLYQDAERRFLLTKEKRRFASGFSSGGAAAMCLAFRYPEKIHGVIMQNYDEPQTFDTPTSPMPIVYLTGTGINLDEDGKNFALVNVPAAIRKFRLLGQPVEEMRFASQRHGDYPSAEMCGAAVSRIIAYWDATGVPKK